MKIAANIIMPPTTKSAKPMITAKKEKEKILFEK